MFRIRRKRALSDSESRTISGLSSILFLRPDDFPDWCCQCPPYQIPSGQWEFDNSSVLVLEMTFCWYIRNCEGCLYEVRLQTLKMIWLFAFLAGRCLLHFLFCQSINSCYYWLQLDVANRDKRAHRWQHPARHQTQLPRTCDFRPRYIENELMRLFH